MASFSILSSVTPDSIDIKDYRVCRDLSLSRQVKGRGGEREREETKSREGYKEGRWPNPAGGTQKFRTNTIKKETAA